MVSPFHQAPRPSNITITIPNTPINHLYALHSSVDLTNIPISSQVPPRKAGEGLEYLPWNSMHPSSHQHV
ncbi:hypothetical protein E2C01_098648 [Portunus trituberculatus]|uniref:Uncharacterized protein n=1 Tax=Portunus trituberculatus TaxID=210409 RepID=A0A5B7K3F5_PORTR|nr:hypothetical protein [Portunus trituberculatus]